VTPPGARDLYAVLEVPRSASSDDLKKAFHRLAKKYHPDVCPNDKVAEDKFKEVASAYQVLSDEEQRAAYDRLGFDGLRRGSQPGTGSPFEGFKSVEDIFSTFSDLFGDFFSQRAPRSARGADLHLEIRVAFDEAVWGTRRDVKLTRTTNCTACGGTGAHRGSRVDACRNCQGKGQVGHAQGFFMVQTECPQCQGRGKTISVPCTSCHGRGLGSETATLSLTIPPGIDDGQTLRVGGKGEGTPGGTAGDLYVVIRVDNDISFEREGNDVTSEVSISFAQAALGGEIEIDTLDDGCRGTAILELAPGTQSGDLVVRHGQGVPHLNGHGRGDHLIRFKIEVPRKLTSKQEKLLREFAAELGTEGKRPRRKRGPLRE
jgi:molecular chaperone DnaJ